MSNDQVLSNAANQTESPEMVTTERPTLFNAFSHLTDMDGALNAVKELGEIGGLLTAATEAGYEPNVPLIGNLIDRVAKSAQKDIEATIGILESLRDQSHPS